MAFTTQWDGHFSPTIFFVVMEIELYGGPGRNLCSYRVNNVSALCP